jgi:hypothetical protein
VCAAELRPERGTTQPIDRFAIPVLGMGVVAEQRLAAILDTEGGVIAGWLR